MPMFNYLSKAFFYPSLAFNVALEKVSTRKWYSRIDKYVILGAFPFRSTVKQLKEDCQVTGVISLNEDWEMKKHLTHTVDQFRDIGITNLRLPTVDYIASPSPEYLQKGVDFMMEHRERKECVYVHCKAGRTRSATLVACYLIEAYYMTPTEAVDYIHEKRPHIWLRETQLSAIDAFYDKKKKDLPFQET